MDVGPRRGHGDEERQRHRPAFEVAVDEQERGGQAEQAEDLGAGYEPRLPRGDGERDRDTGEEDGLRLGAPPPGGKQDDARGGSRSRGSEEERTHGADRGPREVDEDAPEPVRRHAHRAPAHRREERVLHEEPVPKDGTPVGQVVEHVGIAQPREGGYGRQRSDQEDGPGQR